MSYLREVEAKVFTVKSLTTTDRLISFEGKQFSEVNNDKDLLLSECNDCAATLDFVNGSQGNCFTMRRKSKPGTCYGIRKGRTGDYLNEVEDGKCAKFVFMSEAEYQERMRYAGEICEIYNSRRCMY